ncbi:tyrosine-type recombinase/integrase [Tepidibacter aestuarii]|uniref:tyrosine-type recombinase/integrase n=1 Tax=Tepidibacter aestuarii TaxID=2925782 RepID=UPI0020BEACF6|nr:tyrosine-type recombinase/integrase [Tepidibacter aestuarii]CAH2212906.1 site-specific tyrosine recombinase for chromosome partitioning [Tepidibacter aestuarii]
MDNIIDKYIDYIIKDKNLSQNTILSYKSDLKKYISYLKNNSADYISVSENDIFSFLIQLQKSNTSVSTISRIVSSIKSFHEFLFNTRISDNNPARKIRKPKVERPKMDILTQEEVELLLNAPNLENTKGIRDKAILELFYATGIKVSELIQLNVDDVNLNMDYINCVNKKNTRTIPISDTSKKYTQKYLDDSRIKMVKNEDEKALFVNSKGQRFTRQGLWKIIKKYTQNINLDKNVTPTMLRHSFAIHLLKKGANLSVVGKILGNNNLTSLQIYLNHIDNNIRKELKENHPRL